MSRLAYWLSSALLLILVLAKFDPITGFSSLVRFGAEQDRPRLQKLQAVLLETVPNSAGYDGQYYAQIALDPTLHDPDLIGALDIPSYRARRILAPAAAYLLGFGQPGWIVQAYAILNVICWLWLGLLLISHIDPQSPHAFARWFGCMFSMGVLDSVRQSLVDLPALVLLVLAVSAKQRNRPYQGVLHSALGNLTKETNLLATLALYGAPPFKLRKLTPVLIASVPLGVWMVYVSMRFPDGAIGLGNFTWPLIGAIEQGRTAIGELLDGNFDSRHLFAPVSIAGLGLQAAFLGLRRDPSSPWWRIGAAYAALLIFLGPWVWSGYWAACRAVLPMTIAFNLLLPPGRLFWPLWIIGNLTVVHAIWRFL